MTHKHGYSFLLLWMDRITHAWVTKYSIIAIPPLRFGEKNTLETQQRNRDIFISIMLIISIGSIALCGVLNPIGSSGLIRGLASFALYRAFDVFVTVIRTGLFFSFRGDIQINQEPLWRIRRVLLGVMINYIELVMWYSVIYYQLSLTSPCQFKASITRIDQALNLSFTSMTTIGYGGYAPEQLLSTIIAFWQVMTGIILLAIVVGVLIALLTKEEDTTLLENRTREQVSWSVPCVTFLIVYVFLYYLLGLKYC